MIVDAHVHLYPPAANADPLGWATARGEAHWATLVTRRRKDGRQVQGFASVADLLRDMDAAGVGRAILQGWYWEHHGTCAEQNRFYRECVQAHPDRLAAFATLHPAGGADALETVRRAREEGFLGLGELSPHSQHFAGDGAAWREIMLLAGESGLPVTLHVTDPLSRPYPGRVDTPLQDFLGLAREFPRTKFILAHWGGGLAWSPEALAFPNLWFDTAASPLLYGPEVWAKAPRERTLFGSDYPLVLYPRIEQGPSLENLLREARATGVDEAILGLNARTLLGAGPGSSGQ